MSHSPEIKDSYTREELLAFFSERIAAFEAMKKKYPGMLQSITQVIDEYITLTILFTMEEEIFEVLQDTSVDGVPSDISDIHPY